MSKSSECGTPKNMTRCKSVKGNTSICFSKRCQDSDTTFYCFVYTTSSKHLLLFTRLKLICFYPSNLPMTCSLLKLMT